MSEQKNYVFIRENELGYLKVGDYLILAIKLQPNEVKRVGEYGRIRRAFLQEHNTVLFNACWC